MNKFAKLWFFEGDGTVSVARVPEFIEEGDLIRVEFPRGGNTWRYSKNPNFKKGNPAQVVALLEEYDSRSVVSAKVVMTELHHTVIAKIPSIYEARERIRIRWDNELKTWIPAYNGKPAEILKIY